MDLGRGAASLLTKKANLMAWSPDGKRIAFNSSFGGGVFVTDANGASERKLLLPTRAHPVGRRTERRWFLEGDGGLMLLPLDGDRKPVLYLKGTFFQPAFSPDSRWMAYVSEESGKDQVYVQSIPAGHGKWQISSKGGAQPI